MGIPNWQRHKHIAAVNSSQNLIPHIMGSINAYSPALSLQIIHQSFDEITIDLKGSLIPRAASVWVGFDI